MINKLNILVIDDDPAIRNLMRAILKSKANTFVAETPEKALSILENQTADIVISDYKLPGMNGLELLTIINEKYPDTEMIMISADAGMDTVIEAMRLGVTDFFKKPFTAQDIWIAIERTLKLTNLKNNLQKETNHTRLLQNQINSEYGTTIIGNSPQIKDIRNQMEMVAKTPDTSVLILGESGTGKELVARGIHNLSNRSRAPFGAVNMSAIPDTLFESEFFGHKKGSFTGAIDDKAGWFESTSGGTLFLDEIGEMSQSLQVKLLRVLEDRTFIKVGSQKEQNFNVRVVSATNKSIEDLTSGKNFRTDLFHRLGTFIIHLPPLRERKEDIEVLTNYFAKYIGEKLGKQNIKIGKHAKEVLNSYEFPGNIRELKNLMERALILCNGNELQPEHFSLQNMKATGSSKNGNDNTLDLKTLERNTIIKALKKTNYNKSEACKLLNIEWNALYRRIQKYDIAMK